MVRARRFVASVSYVHGCARTRQFMDKIVLCTGIRCERIILVLLKKDLKMLYLHGGIANMGKSETRGEFGRANGMF